jgi:SAM-dependent MidA family methyltransferase
LVAGGRLLVFDYGATTVELAGRPQTSWLRTYRRHGRGGPATQHPGQQDITCEVPFDQLPPPGHREAQSTWLRRHGIDELVEEGRRQWVDGAARGDLAALRARSRVREAEALLEEGGLGAFTVTEWSAAGGTAQDPAGDDPPS